MKHKVRVIPKEEILANRSNAYEFIDFDKEITFEEVFNKEKRQGIKKFIDNHKQQDNERRS